MDLALALENNKKKLTSNPNILRNEEKQNIISSFLNFNMRKKQKTRKGKFDAAEKWLHKNCTPNE
jgi:hypothetical protein